MLTDGTSYYLVKIKEEFEDHETGKVKKDVKQKLVRAVSVTDSEAKVTKLYDGVTWDWNVISSVETKIDEVIDGDK